MDPLTLSLGLGLGGGLLNFIKGQKAKGEAKKNYQLASQVARYSPWTKMDSSKYTPSQLPDVTSGVLGGALQGGLTGYMQGKNMQTVDLQNKLLESLSNSSNERESSLRLSFFHSSLNQQCPHFIQH